MCDYQDQLNRNFIMFTMTIAHLNSAMNPILYGIFNTTFKKGYIAFIKIIFCRKSFRNDSSKTGLTYNKQTIVT